MGVCDWFPPVREGNQIHRRNTFQTYKLDTKQSRARASQIKSSMTSKSDLKSFATFHTTRIKNLRYKNLKVGI